MTQTELSEHKQRGEQNKSFAMMILDLDDTLIPTSIRKFLFKNFEIDIYTVLKEKLLKELQLNIIKSLQNITQKLNKAYDHLEIALVSNAKPSWLNQMLGPQSQSDRAHSKASKRSKCSKKPIFFNILGEYFMNNMVSIHSAKSENDYDDTDRENKENPWILKYKSISALIAQKQKYLNMKCTQIISFGDGFNEKESLRVYSVFANTRCIHFEFIKAPSVYQLNKEWNLISNVMDIVSVIKMDYFVMKTDNKLEKTSYFVYNIGDVLKNNNDKKCTGKHQLNAISKYFSVWIKSVNEDKNYKSRGSIVVFVEKINLRRCVMMRNNKYENTAYKKAVDAFCSHRKFKSVFQPKTR